MAQITGRALHFVFKIGNRAKNAHFFRNVLGMKVQRHEEFKEGCDAECNGPYDNRWSKTMIGYGAESSHFVIELTYNYGVKSYELGNDFGGLTIKSKEILERAKEHKYPILSEGNSKLLVSPDGYKFYIIDEPQPADTDPVQQVSLNVTNLEKSKKYWHELLGMKIVNTESKAITLTYGEKQATLKLQQISDPVNHAQAYGRIAFAVPQRQQQPIMDVITKAEGKILKPLIKLDTPGKASVHVIILADPDGHEICFVDEEGFSELSQYEEAGNKSLDKFIGKDPFQDK